MSPNPHGLLASFETDLFLWELLLLSSDTFPKDLVLSFALLGDDGALRRSGLLDLLALG